MTFQGQEDTQSEQPKEIRDYHDNDDKLADLLPLLTLQVWQGCGHADCPSPACFSYEKSHVTVPLRRWTHLSARSIALVLASTDKPQQWICPYINLDTTVEQIEPERKRDPKSLIQQLALTKSVSRATSSGPSTPDSRHLSIKAPDHISPYSSTDCRVLFNVLCEKAPNFSRARWWSMAHCLLQPDMTAPPPSPAAALDYCTGVDWYEYPPAVAACDNIIKLLANGMAGNGSKVAALEHLAKLQSTEDGGDNRSASQVWLLWLQLTFLRHWKGACRVPVDRIAGAALLLMAQLWEHRTHPSVCLVPNDFIVSRIHLHLNVEESVQSWLEPWKEDTFHIFRFSFLFDNRSVTEYFRTACHLRMRKAYAAPEALAHMRAKVFRPILEANSQYLNIRLRVLQQHYLVLNVSRESVVSDALDQLWQREQQELFRPLRVRMGIEEGEIGHDLGGVQVEFFNLVCKEAFDSQRSLFVTDPLTHMAWFQPLSLEPLYRYELIGLLFGLAVYNGITLPVSFPLAFYRKLLGLRCSFNDLKEGWPMLANGMQKVLDYKGDVEADIAMDYVFSVAHNGFQLEIEPSNPWKGKEGTGPGHLRVFNFNYDDHKAQKRFNQSHDPADYPELETIRYDGDAMTLNLDWPGWIVQIVDAEEPSPVTNENRERYVQDSTNWTLDWSIRPQMHAFGRGFYKVVNPIALRLLPPGILRTLVEGHNHLNIDELERATSYDGYTTDSIQIMWFWDIVKSYNQEKQKQLLEFVTASTRVPINGAGSLVFRIECADGNTESLPGSSTCFGTLRLPPYESLEKMRRKLDIALEHSLGFGQA